MRKYTAILMVTLLLLSGCSAISVDSLPDEVLDPYYNPHNHSTVSDGEYIFFSDSSGIYKMPINGGTAQRILSLDDTGILGSALALHNSFIYYTVSSNIYRIDKDSNNQKVIQTSNSSLIDNMVCLQDLLYIETINSGFFSADVKSDPEMLEFKNMGQLKK